MVSFLLLLNCILISFFRFFCRVVWVGCRLVIRFLCVLFGLLFVWIFWNFFRVVRNLVLCLCILLMMFFFFFVCGGGF